MRCCLAAAYNGSRNRHLAYLQLQYDLVRVPVSRKDAVARIAAWSQKEIDPGGRRRFAELAEAELISLHEGNFARYRIRPSEFAAWRQVWEAR